VATALAAGMPTLSLTYAFAEIAGRQIPDLLLAVVVIYVGISLGIGVFGERLGKAHFDAAAESLALQDPSTGLPNRRHAELQAEMQFAAAERGQPLAVVLFDLDHFAAYNEKNGRGAGDGVLRSFATMLRQQTRRMDLAARFGPEEFISLLSGCSEEGAVIFAGRLQEKLRAAETVVTLPTVSAGIAVYRPDMRSAEELLQSAERALLQAKRDGRDRVRVHGREHSELPAPQGTEAQWTAAEGSVAGAAAALDAVRAGLTARGATRVGAGRTAFLLSVDPATRAELGGFLRSQGFALTEGRSLRDTVIPLQQEFDLVMTDVGRRGTPAADMIRQLRRESPSTRVVGLPRRVPGGVHADSLMVRVDAYYPGLDDPAAVCEQLAELLAERDARRDSLVRQRVMSDEIRAMDRESRTALAASEAKYRRVVQTVQEVIFSTDAAGRWTFLNPAWTAITGFSIEESVGQPLFGFLHPEDAPAVRARFLEALEQRSAYLRHECRWRTRGGAHRWIELRLQLDVSPTGMVEGSTGVLQDVTERRSAETALRESEQLLLRAQKMDAIGRLAGGVAHDFNNLLTTIQGHVELLITDVGEDSAIGAELTEVREAAARATSLTRQLLAFSRRQVLQPRVLDLNAVIRDMERMLRRVIGENVTLTLALAEDTGCVRADPAQIEQVLLNLVVNARDAMPRGGSVRISTARREFTANDASGADQPAGSYVVLQVQDAGMGMTSQVAAQAFEPFFTTKGPGGGTGLGLSTVYGIVRQSGGHVWLRSQPGVGTDLIVALPAVADEPVDALPETGSAPLPVSQLPEQGRGTILLVEDEKGVRELTQRVLERHGYAVLAAEGGQAALDMLATAPRRIDLLLTDVVMPEMGGRDLAATVRTRVPDLPVLFISGYNEDAVLNDGVLVEGSSFLEKPFTPAALVECVAGILSRTHQTAADA
jgi:two-component system, cell cycle sensor histidine kinase and response regulator CckA